MKQQMKFTIKAGTYVYSHTGRIFSYRQDVQVQGYEFAGAVYFNSMFFMGRDHGHEWHCFAATR